MAFEPLEIEVPGGEIGKTSASEGPSPLAAQILREKYQDYLRGSRWHKVLYYLTRLLAGLSAVLLPFVVGTMPIVATSLSAAVLFCIVVDMVFDPKTKWALYSRATDLLAIAELKRRGEYDKYKDALEVLLTTEQQKLSGLKELEDVLRKVEQGKKPDAA